MYVSAIAVVLLRFSRLKLSLLVVALAGLLLSLAVPSGAQTFTSSGGITVSGTLSTSEGSTVSVTGLPGTVTGMSLTFNGLAVSNLNDVAIVLVPPSASGLTPLDLFSGICGYGSQQIGNSTFTLADSGATGSDNFSGMLPYLGGTCPSTLSGTYLPTDYFPEQDVFNSPGPSTYNSAGPGSAVCDPLNVTCGNDGFVTGFGLPSAAANLSGTWTLYIANQAGPPYNAPSGSLSSWSLTFTTASATATSTTISGNLNGVSSAVFTNTDVNNDATAGTAVTFTATVSPTPSGGGTVKFYDSTGTTAGSGTLLASGVPVNGAGQAQAIVTFPGTEEGSRSITAVYSGVPNAYTASTTTAPATVVTVNHPYNSSGATFCNGPVKLNDDTGGSPYPSMLVLGNSFSQLAGTIESVSVTLNGINLQSGIDLQDLGVMLQAPGVSGTQTLSEGNAFQFLSWAGGPYTSGSLTFSDSGTAEIPSSSSPGCTLCLPTDDHIDVGTSNPDTYPAPAPASFATAAPTGASTFLTEFGGLGANGTWSLFLDNRLTEGGALGSIASWCVNFTMQANAHPTATAASGSPNPATFASPNTTASVNLVANVTTTDNSGTVTAGSVTFVDGSTNLGSPTVVNGQAMLTVALSEGTHQIVASYSGTSTGTEFGISSQKFDVRVDKTPTVSGFGAGPYAYCNSGSITAPGLGDDAGAASPYPSNILVSNLPGTVNAVTVTLNGFTTRDQGDLMSLLVGPGGNNLEFFSLTGSNVSNSPPPFNITFADGGASIGGNLASSGTYAPASFNNSNTYPQCPPNATDCGTENVGPPLGSNPFFTPTNKAASAGTAILGNSSAAGVFGGTSSSTYNGNGTWSLYIDDGGPTGGGETTNINGGWCVNLTVNQPALAISMSDSGNFYQGDTADTYTINVKNNGPGPTGGIVTVTEAPPTGLTVTGLSGTNWTCSTVSLTCTYSLPVAATIGFPAITATVSVAANAPASVTNAATVSGGGSAGTEAATDATTIKVPPAITTQPVSQTVANSSTATFTVVATGLPTLTYQWQYLSGSTWKAFGAGTGLTTATMTTFATTGAYSGLQFRVVVTDGFGKTVTSNTATLTVGPAITTQPVSQTVVDGNTATFSVVAAGVPTLTYQWQYLSGSTWKAFGAGTGLTTASMTTFATTAAYSGLQFRVVVTDGNSNTVTSNAVTLTVGPAITTQPVSQTVTDGSTATFSVVAAGVPTLTYQWQYLSGSTWKAFGAGTGLTTASMTTFATTAAYNGLQFRVLVTDGNSSTVTSNTVTLTVGPAITTQPVSQTVTDGSTATYSVVAAGVPTLSYQWQYLSGSTWKAFGAGTGLTTASMTTFATTAAYSGLQFRVLVTDGNSNTVTSNTVTLTVGPAITTQPVSQTVTDGSTATFSVVAAGVPTLTYQWQYLSGSTWKAFGAGTGLTTASMTTFATTAAYNGLQFRVLVTDGNSNTVTSNTVTLTVAPAITTQPVSQTVTSGNTATFSVVAVGVPTLTYQWQYLSGSTWKAFGAGTGLTTATMTTFATTGAYNGLQFRVLVTDGNSNTVTSNTVTLTVQ